MLCAQLNFLSTFHWRKQKPDFYVSYFLIFSHFTFSEADLIFSQRFPLATSIVSRRSSRSYSHQTFWRPVRSASLTRVKITRAMFCQTTIAWGVVGGARYARRSHYQTARYRNVFFARDEADFEMQQSGVLPAQCLPLPLNSLALQMGKVKVLLFSKSPQELSQECQGF